MLFKKNLDIPAAGNALPGRAKAIPTASSHFVSGRPLKGPYPEGMASAMFALGCFWGAEKKFWQIPGVWVTAVGYVAGQTPNPTYEEVCSGRTGHNEAVLVVYDPKQVTYQELLKAFWETHDPTQGMRQGNDVGTQYRSGIYVYSEEQRRVAEAAKASYEKALKALIRAAVARLASAARSRCRQRLSLHVTHREFLANQRGRLVRHLLRQFDLQNCFVGAGAGKETPLNPVERAIYSRRRRYSRNNRRIRIVFVTQFRGKANLRINLNHIRQFL
jgi:peptide-methionine (S)-S-oxide reductase